MLYNFPSNFIFWTKVRNHEQLKKKLLPQIYANESEIAYDGAYQDSVTNYFEENNILLDMGEEEYHNIIWDPFNEMLQDPNLRILHTPEESQLQSIWYNVYRDKKCWHKTHTHPSSTFSGIYLLHLEGENGTVFTQLGHQLFMQNYETKHNTEGDVIIFPSSLPHSVISFDTHKISISFNIMSRNKTYGNLF
tara:strand:+ start:632 stop:1207 length:576 start_codon:yes stop_codon:yes gene_type:complete